MNRGRYIPLAHIRDLVRASCWELLLGPDGRRKRDQLLRNLRDFYRAGEV